MQEYDKFIDRSFDLQTPPWEEPIDHMLRVGPKNMTTYELLAVVIGNGRNKLQSLNTALHLMTEFENIRNVGHASLEELMAFDGIGLATAAHIKACAELGLRMDVPPNINRLHMNSPDEGAKYLMARIGHEDQEHLHALYLNSRNRPSKTIRI